MHNWRLVVTLNFSGLLLLHCTFIHWTYLRLCVTQVCNNFHCDSSAKTPPLNIFVLLLQYYLHTILAWNCFSFLLCHLVLFLTECLFKNPLIKIVSLKVWQECNYLSLKSQMLMQMWCLGFGGNKKEFSRKHWYLPQSCYLILWGDLTRTWSIETVWPKLIPCLWSLQNNVLLVSQDCS